jgi:hypothetical protein
MNLAASIHQRLLNQAFVLHTPFNEILQYYAIERFLARLDKSPYRNRVVLKGALAFHVWQAPLGRPTRDMDFLGYTSNSRQNLISIVKEICSQPVEEDGISFLPESVEGEIIQEQRDYSGVRINFRGFLGNAKVHMRMDVGFSDSVTPQPTEKVYPTILEGLPSPRVLTYPPETMIAEKFHGIVSLEMINSRLKDFYDLWFMTETLNFDYSLLQSAIQNTFQHRNTPFPASTPAGLTLEFAQSKQEEWGRYLKKNGLVGVPENFEMLIQRLILFFDPMLHHEISVEKWVAGVGWR